ncbi:MAG: hypothetical protein DWP95_05745 [Proteobacteria bacterium]|nr:MAG: hypothetical protein DWP95_05745 [Pseudomonadota bacterium]
MATLSKIKSQPSIRFFHSIELKEKTDAVLSELESNPDYPKHGHAMADLVAELIDAGMDYYFVKALKQAEIGFISEKSAMLGIASAVKLISSVSRKFIVRMDANQLSIVASHIQSLAASK